MPRPVITRVRIACLAAALLLAACASDEPAPVEDHSIPLSESEGGAAAPQAGATAYRVQKGDTLYAIAFTRGLDYRDLAAWNHIEPPYRIFIGQELALKPAAAPAADNSGGGAVATAAPDTATAATVSALPGSPQSARAENAASPAKQATTLPPAAAISAQAKPADTEPAAPVRMKPAAAGAGEPAAKSAEATPQLSAGGVSWRWPADGSVIGTYIAGDQTRQGIDIAGKEGDAVVATADGEVVYSGNGLLGYGELIIIKHNATFLSAYGHNRKRLVQEGERVRGGQRIAEMGASAAARDELHFEIRKSGKPVNPLDYLPVR